MHDFRFDDKNNAYSISSHLHHNCKSNKMQKDLENECQGGKKMRRAPFDRNF